MSVAGLLEMQGGAVEYLKAFNQLLHEYEYHSTHEPGSLSAKPKMVDLPLEIDLIEEEFFQTC
jgi:hypothetical protein